MERDDRLAGARPALDEDDRLARVVEPVAGLRQDGLECDSLLVEQHEVAVGRDHRGRVFEELAARSIPRLENAGHDGLAAAGAQLMVEKLSESVRLVAGVDRVAVERLSVTVGP